MTQAAADDVVSSIVAGGGTAIAVQADMSKEDEVVAMFARIDEMEGALTAVVNNAAIIGPKNEVSQGWALQGLPPSWPNLQCANQSYAGPDSSYAHVLSLAQGSHTLWTGMLVMVSANTQPQTQGSRENENSPRGADRGRRDWMAASLD